MDTAYSIMQPIFIASHQKNGSNWENEQAFRLDLWIGNTEKTYNRILDMVRRYTPDVLAKQLMIMFDPRCGSTLCALNGKKAATLRAAMDRPIFPAYLAKALGAHGKDEWTVEKTLKRYIDETNPLEDGTRESDEYTDLLRWGLDWLDIAGYVRGETDGDIPTWNDVLYTVLDFTKWEYLARHYYGL